MIGGKVLSLGTNARLGLGEYMVAEADESDGSFLLLSPTIAVVTNIDPEHLDHYGSVERAADAFLEFVNRVPFYGLAVLCLDSPRVRALLPRVRKRYVTYGLSPDAEISARDLVVEGFETRFVVTQRGEDLGAVRVGMPGVTSRRTCSPRSPPPASWASTSRPACARSASSAASTAASRCAARRAASP